MLATQKKVAVLIEGDFYEHEIWYYTIDSQRRGFRSILCRAYGGSHR